MNTNLFTQEDKDFLIENGYLIIDVEKIVPFELQEAIEVLNECNTNKLYDILILQPTYLSAEELNYIDVNFPNTKMVENSHDKWTGPQDELDGIREYVFRNGDSELIPQVWIESNSTRSITLFLNLRLAISKELYNYTRSELRKQGGVITEFTNYGKIITHADAVENSQRLCVITFYLNDKSEAEGNGGELVLTSKKGDKITIPPYKGTAVI